MPRPIKSSDDQPSIFPCLWSVSKDLNGTTRCPCTFTDPDALYVHLSEDHIGRKALGTLQLTCRWIGCLHQNRHFSKRDNVVSHARSHVHFRANICVDCGSQFKWPQDLKKHCIKLEHTYIVPESKGKPGPSPVYVEETEDGGHSIVRYGPSLNGGRQKTYQRCSAPEGSMNSASVTHGLVTSNPNDKCQGNTTQTEVTVSVTKIEAEPKIVVEPIKLSPSLPERLPGIQALMAKEEFNNSSRTNTTIQYQTHPSMQAGAYFNEGIVDYDHSRSYLPSPKSEHHRRMNTPNQHLESWNKPPVYVPTMHQQRYDHGGYQHQRNPLFQETNYQTAYANHEAYGASNKHGTAPSHVHPHVQHVSYSSHWYHFARQPYPPSFEDGVQSNAHEEYYSRQQQHHHATAPMTVSSPLHNPRHGGHHDVYPFQNEDSRAGYHIPQYINAQRC